jgi:serpin B
MRRIVPLIVVLVVLIGGCLGGVENSKPTRMVYSTESHSLSPTTRYDGLKEGQETPIVVAINAFSLDLYRELAKNETNVFFSPFSIETALAMVDEGASGETEKEMESVLHLPENRSTRWVGFRYLILSLKSPEGSPFILRSVNALWIQRGYPLHEKYLQVIGEFYLGEVKEVDLQGNTKEATREINEWVEKQTNGRIKDIVSGLSPLTRLVITNAIYFKANWSSRFNPSKTHNDTFFFSRGSVIVPFMEQVGMFNYTEGSSFQALELPYEGKRFSMIIILPKSVDGIRRLEGNLSVQFLKELVRSLRLEKVRVILPKFRFEASYKLRNVLIDMGMDKAFTSADFSGISDEPLAISQVIHKSFISVAENGTEAAAATAVTLTLAAPPESEKPKVFDADHPFIFFIYDWETGTVLFMGRLVNPKE